MKKFIIYFLLFVFSSGIRAESYYILRYKYSALFPYGISIGGGIDDKNNIRMNFGFAQPTTGNDWGKLLPKPANSNPPQPPPPNSGGGAPPPQPPTQADVKIDGKAYMVGLSYDHYFLRWFGIYTEVNAAWINALPSKNEISSTSITDGPPPQKKNIYFCLPVETGLNLKLFKFLTLGGGYQYHYKGYQGWTISAGVSIDD